MKKLLFAVLLPVTLALTGCASVFGPPPAPGASEQEVVARMGAPASRYRVGDQTLLEYPGGYYGQRTWMARMGPDGKLIAIEQVRSLERFGRIKINESTRQDVLQTVGTPSEKSRVAMSPFEIWEYRYKESEVWNSIMYIHLDSAGIVRKMENARDPLYDTSERRR